MRMLAGARRAAVAGMLAAASLLAGCVAIPVVHVSVLEGSGRELFSFAEEVEGRTRTAFDDAASPIPGAIVAVCDPEHLEECKRVVSGISEPAISRLCGSARGRGRWPVLIRTDDRGTAEYSELRKAPFLGFAAGPVNRCFIIRADGFALEVVSVEIDYAVYQLAVPLRRTTSR